MEEAKHKSEMNDAVKSSFGNGTKGKDTLAMGTVTKYVFPPVLNTTKPF